MMKTFQFVIIVCFIAASCKYKNNSNSTVAPLLLNPGSIKISINDGIEEINNIGQLIDSVKYIPLETDTNSLIAEITRLEYVNDTFIIFDNPGKSVLFFDSRGRFLHKTGGLGRGPDEYSSIRCIAINPYFRKVYLYDQYKFSILEYDFDGKFLASHNYDGLYPTSFYSKNDSFVFFQNKLPYDGNYYDLITMQKGAIVNKQLPFSKGEEQWFSPKYPFYELNNKLNYIDNWNSRILELGDSLSVKYLFDFGKDALPAGYTKDLKGFSKNKKKFSYFLGDFFENENYLCFHVNHCGKLLTCLYIKRKNKLYSIKTTGESWHEKIPVIFSFPRFARENFFVSSITPQNCMVLTEMQDRIKDKPLVKIAAGLNITSNPVLAMYYFKQQ